MEQSQAPRGDAVVDTSGDVDVVERLLRERHSCRAFQPESVPRPTIERILELAQRTASWCNSQPWQVIVTEGAGTERFRQALVQHVAGQGAPESDFPFPREYHGVYQDRRRESGFQLYETLGIARGDRVAYERQAFENFRLFGAPHVAIITSDEALGPYGAVDCGGYVGNFLLAAQAHGVATIAQAALARYSTFVRQHFGLGEDRRMVCGISFGFADRDHPVNTYRTSRATVSQAATFVGD